MKYLALAFALVITASAYSADRPTTPMLEHRWVFTMTNLARDEALRSTLELMQRAHRAGYNGIFVSDSKFAKFQLQDAAYAKNVRRLRAACTAESMALVVNVCPMGYAAELLAADPNLAEGMPVRGAEFFVKAGRLVPVDTAQLQNGSLAEWKKGSPVEWFVDGPGKLSFQDDKVRLEGRSTLRQEHAAAGRRPVRLVQKIRIEPWHCYHLSVMARTEDCTSKDFRITALGSEGPLNWQPMEIKKTSPWTRYHATFTSGDNHEVTIYLGSYGPKGGTIWWSDVQIEPAGFMNVIRRPSLPLSVTSPDGKTTYTEGRDFATVADPRLGHDPNPGYFTYWHEPPTTGVPAGSRLKEGDRVRASYHFATLAGKSHQINCCLSEPKIYELIAAQARWVKETAAPDVYMMGYDEIRHCGWDDSCSARHLTCGQILAENVRRCAAIFAAADPGKTIATWNDMFDPFHNAHKDGGMYLARGNGPWYGSWEGLPRSVLVVNWANNNADSLKFFADRGHAQVLAGYYDADPRRIAEWLRMAAKVHGVKGVMYTTWANDYSKLEQFLEIAKKTAEEK